MTDWRCENTIKKLDSTNWYRTLAPTISQSTFFSSIPETLIQNDHVLIYKAKSPNFKDVYLSNLQSLGDLSLQSIRVTTRKKKNLSALKNDKEEYKFHWLWLTNRPAFGHKIIDFTLNATVEVFKCLGTHSNPHTPPRPHIPVDQVFSHLVHLQWRL